jgi:hypothetical protein
VKTPGEVLQMTNVLSELPIVGGSNAGNPNSINGFDGLENESVQMMSSGTVMLGLKSVITNELAGAFTLESVPE